MGEFFPEAKWQRCVVHWYRNVMNAVPRSRVREVMAMLKAIHAQEDRAAARRKAREVEKKLLALKLEKAAKVVREGVEETLSYMSFPREHWLKIRTTNPLERASTGRSGGAPAWWGPSPTAMRPSSWSRRGSDILPARAGARRCT